MKKVLFWGHIDFEIVLSVSDADAEDDAALHEMLMDQIGNGDSGFNVEGDTDVPVGGEVDE